MKTLKLAPEWPVLVHRLKSFAYLTDPSQYLAICSSPRVALRSGRFCIHMLVEHIRIRTVRAGSFVFATSTAGCEQTPACALTRTTQSGLIRSSWKTRRCLQMYAFENCIDWPSAQTSSGIAFSLKGSNTSHLFSYAALHVRCGGSLYWELRSGRLTEPLRGRRQRRCCRCRQVRVLVGW